MLKKRRTTWLLLLVFLTGYGSAIAKESSPAEQAVSEELIKTAFNKYFEHLKSSMYRRLTKDKDGNNDTYVLYDVQTHMQNAVIYADERGDKEILSNLLELSLIPFEPRHMTDGKWLNNTYGLVGVEVDLCIAQYFSLLTRVLSACERHHIATDFSDENFESSPPISITGSANLLTEQG